MKTSQQKIKFFSVKKIYNFTIMTNEGGQLLIRKLRW